MMDSMRRAAQSWVAKALIGLLAVSFGIWGIADVFRGGSATTLAEAGDTKISQQEFDRAFRNYLESIRRQSGQVFSQEDARKLGMDRLVLERLLSDAALDSQAKSLRLAVSDRQIVDETAENPAFKGSDGKFDHEQFLKLLAANGLSEAEYVANERRNRMRDAIIGTAAGGFKIPLSLVEAAYRFRNEQRDARYFVVSTAETEVAAATDDEIKKEYETNGAAYTAPEYRSAAVIKVEPADITGKITLSDADLQAGYGKYKEDYATPETRTILQLSFASLDDAKKAKDRIAGGTAFEDIAKEMGIKDSDYTFADRKKADFLDPVIGEAAFALAEGAVSDPVKGTLATVLLKATKISPAHQPALDEIRDQLSDRLKLEQARDEIQSVHDQVEDGLGGQKKFEDIAASTGLPLITITAVDQQGLGKDGKPVQMPQQGELLKAIFASDVGVENPALSLDDGYIWYDVREVVPSALKPFENVKEEARKAVIAQKVRELSMEKAAKLLEQLKGGSPLEDLAKESNAEIKTAQGLKRGETSVGFDAAAVKAVFGVPENGFAMALETDGKGARIIQSAAVLLPPFQAGSAESKAIADELNAGSSEDLLGAYTVALKKDVGVTVNETLWRQISGAASQ